MLQTTVITYKISPTSNYEGDEGDDRTNGCNLIYLGVLLDSRVKKQAMVAFDGREGMSFNALSPPIIVLKHAS
jgi:hypothetical protein